MGMSSSDQIAAELFPALGIDMTNLRYATLTFETGEPVIVKAEYCEVVDADLSVFESYKRRFKIEEIAESE